MERSCEELLKMAKAADEDDRPATAAECLLAASRMNQTLPSWASLRLADNLRAIGRIDQARKILKEIGEYPENKAWLVNLHRGQVEYDAGDFQSAAHRFETSLEQNPGSTVPYVCLASAYSAMRQVPKAIETLIAGLRAEGDRDEVYLNLGYKYRTMANYRLAQEAFTNALRITPHYPKAEAALRDIASVLELIGEDGHAPEP